MRFRQPREKDERHLEFIRSLPCVSCGNPVSTEAAHLRAGNWVYGKRGTGMQEKPSDKWVLPLCSACHREQHEVGEEKFWGALQIDPFALAIGLYNTSGDISDAGNVLEAHGTMPAHG